jgi:hypothetical protein
MYGSYQEIQMRSYQEIEMSCRQQMARVGPLLVLAFAVMHGTPAGAEQSAGELARAAQNPVANLISVPFQDNINFNVGPENKTQNVLNIQPVIPVSLNPDWNLITRTIIPVISQPAFTFDQDRTNGLGDIQFTAFLSPAKAHGLIWGVGAVAQLPTNTSDALGNDHWGLGPSAVVLRMDGPWVYGALVNNVWSVGSGSDLNYNNFLVQPFINYNFKGGLYLSSAPIITANWEADSGNRWTVPIGGGIGKIVHLGRLPVNLQTQVFYNVVSPDNGGDWTWRLQLQLMFPK